MKLILQPDRRMLRQFAWACLFLLPAIAGFLAWKHDLPTVWVFVAIGVGVFAALIELVLMVVAESVGLLLEKTFLRPLFQGLALVAFPIGFVLSHVLIASIYYLVVTPIALVFRLVGRDAIGRRINRHQGSYWTNRSVGRTASSYFKLY
jgi:hypothetical protein